MVGAEVEGGTSTEITCNGRADYARKHLQLACDYGGGGDFELINLGTRTFVRGEILGALDAGSKWITFTDDENLGREFAPRRLLSM